MPKILLLITTDANLMYDRKIKHNKKVCRAQDLGSYVQGQGHRSEVKIMSKL